MWIFMFFVCSTFLVMFLEFVYFSSQLLWSCIIPTVIVSMRFFHSEPSPVWIAFASQRHAGIGINFSNMWKLFSHKAVMNLENNLIWLSVLQMRSSARIIHLITAKFRMRTQIFILYNLIYRPIKKTIISTSGSSDIK